MDHFATGHFEPTLDGRFSLGPSQSKTAFQFRIGVWGYKDTDGLRKLTQGGFRPFDIDFQDNPLTGIEARLYFGQERTVPVPATEDFEAFEKIATVPASGECLLG